MEKESVRGKCSAKHHIASEATSSGNRPTGILLMTHIRCIKLHSSLQIKAISLRPHIKGARSRYFR